MSSVSGNRFLYVLSRRNHLSSPFVHLVPWRPWWWKGLQRMFSAFQYMLGSLRKKYSSANNSLLSGSGRSIHVVYCCSWFRKSTVTIYRTTLARIFCRFISKYSRPDIQVPVACCPDEDLPRELWSMTRPGSTGKDVDWNAEGWSKVSSTYPDCIAPYWGPGLFLNHYLSF